MAHHKSFDTCFPKSYIYVRHTYKESCVHYQKRGEIVCLWCRVTREAMQIVWHMTCCLACALQKAMFLDTRAKSPLKTTKQRGRTPFLWCRVTRQAMHVVWYMMCRLVYAHQNAICILYTRAKSPLYTTQKRGKNTFCGVESRVR